MAPLSERIRQVAPGILFTGLLAVLAEYSAEITGTVILGFDNSPVSSVMVALILGGLVANTVGTPARCENGAEFSVKKILKFGVVLLGFRLSIYEAVQVGVRAIPVVAASIATALILVLLASKMFGIERRLGILIGVGTAICGVSAIVATAPTINARDEETGYAVATITVLGLLATLLYPFVGRILFAGVEQSVGLWLGTAVHDTSQVTGAALVYSETYQAETTLDTAVVTKLLRNTFMIAVIPLAGIASHRRHPEKSVSRLRKGLSIFPIFVVWFLGLSLLRTIGDIMLAGDRLAFAVFDMHAWTTLAGLLSELAIVCLLIALAGVGLRTDIRQLLHLGISPFLVGLAAALGVGGVSALTIAFLL